MKLKCIRGVLFVLVSVIFGLIGSIVMAVGIRTTIVVWQSHEWSSVPAVITEAWVSKASSSRGGYSYCPRWRYQYDVNDIAHQSDLVAYGILHCFKSEKEAKHALGDFQVGTTTQAYIDPMRQNHAVLKVVNNGWWVYIVATVLGLLAAVLGFWNAVRLWIA